MILIYFWVFYRVGIIFRVLPIRSGGFWRASPLGIFGLIRKVEEGYSTLLEVLIFSLWWGSLTEDSWMKFLGIRKEGRNFLSNLFFLSYLTLAEPIHIWKMMILFEDCTLSTLIFCFFCGRTCSLILFPSFSRSLLNTSSNRPENIWYFSPSISLPVWNHWWRA